MRDAPRLPCSGAAGASAQSAPPCHQGRPDLKVGKEMRIANRNEALRGPANHHAGGGQIRMAKPRPSPPCARHMAPQQSRGVDASLPHLDDEHIIIACRHFRHRGADMVEPSPDLVGHLLEIRLPKSLLPLVHKTQIPKLWAEDGEHTKAVHKEKSCQQTGLRTNTLRGQCCVACVGLESGRRTENSPIGLRE